MKRSFARRNDLFLFGLIFLAVLAIYGGTFTNFFTADDLWQVHYAYKIFNGDAQLLWQNFAGNYIAIPGFEFYRPLLGLTYWIDYGIWNINPLGYHLTSTMLYLADVVLLYYFVKRLVVWFFGNESAGTTAAGATAALDDAAVNELAATNAGAASIAERNERTNVVATSAAAATAALFAVSPLHCEAVTWISGRADVLAAVFYLAALNTVLKRDYERAWRWQVFGCLCFILALGAKEIALGLPVIVLTLFVLKPRVAQDSFAVSMKHSLKLVFPYITIAGAYLVLRYFIFGPSLGGYTGSFGLVKATYASLLWFDPRVWLRILFPFNREMIFPIRAYELALFVLLAGGCVLAAVRARAERTLRWRLPVFLLIWMATTLIPLATVWGLDPLLHNSRLLFFMTMPLSATLPLALFAHREPSKQYLAGAMVAGMVLVLGLSSFISNQAWGTAGDIVKMLRTRCDELTAKLSKDQKIIVLGIPDDYKGAMVLLNASTLHHLLTPPFCNRSVIDNVVTFKPFLIGPGNVVDPIRFKRTLLEPGKVQGVYAWNESNSELELIPLSQIAGDEAKELPKPDALRTPIQFSADQVQVERTKRTHRVIMDGLKLNPLDVDFVRFDLTLNETPNGTQKRTSQGTSQGASQEASPANRNQTPYAVPVTLWWNGDDTNRSRGMAMVLPPPQKTPVSIALSDTWRWYAQPQINRIEIQLGNSFDGAVDNIHLLKADSVVPSLTLAAPQRTTGEYIVSPETVKITWDASAIQNARNVMLEVTKPNSFFEGSHLLRRQDIVGNTKSLTMSNGSAVLPREWFTTEAFYELRVHALDADNQPVGEFSSPATIFCGSAKSNIYID